MHTIVFEAIGTHWQIDFDHPDSDRTAIESKIRSTIEAYDHTYSRFRKDALLVQASQKAETYTLPSSSKALLSLYKKLYDVTDGLFTPLIGQVLSDAGYDADYSLTPRNLHTPPKWDDVITFNYPKLTLKKPALLDVGAAGKGQLIDIVASILEKSGSTKYVVDAGGDILHRGLNTFEIGLEHPENLEQVIGIATIQNRSICGSAGNRRNWGPYHHIINPDTLASPTSVLAVWVVADTTMIADGISTCLFLVEPQKLEATFPFEYLILYQDYSMNKSKDFPAKIFTA